MPPVEKEMAALTFLGPEKVTADPRCPPKECVQEMLWLSYWQLSEKLNTADRDTKNLVDSALSAHSQLTRGVGVAMSSAMMSRRQIWLAQTTLPENFKKGLTNMQVEQGSMFHPDSQNVLRKAEQTYQGVCAMHI